MWPDLRHALRIDPCQRLAVNSHIWGIETAIPGAVDDLSFTAEAVVRRQEISWYSLAQVGACDSKLLLVGWSSFSALCSVREHLVETFLQHEESNSRMNDASPGSYGSECEGDHFARRYLGGIISGWDPRRSP